MKKKGTVRVIGLGLAVLALMVSAATIARHHHREKPAAGTPGEFDYYLLTLSWSPSYCLTHQQDRAQCGGKGYGFVLHGLWPQYDAGSWPEFCVADSPLPPEAVQMGRTLYPSPKLMEHEWQRHGTCSGMDATGYLKTADQALAKVQVPHEFEAPRQSQSLSAEQIMASFRRSNPSISTEGITVACSRGELSEVRVCLTRELMPRSCGRGVRSSCPSEPVNIPASRGQ
jgi:ribonuclease T2